MTIRTNTRISVVAMLILIASTSACAGKESEIGEPPSHIVEETSQDKSDCIKLAEEGFTRKYGHDDVRTDDVRIIDTYGGGMSVEGSVRNSVKGGNAFNPDKKTNFSCRIENVDGVLQPAKLERI